MAIYKANDKYRATLRTTWIASPAATTLEVTAVPDNVPTIVTLGWETSLETTFYVTGKSGSTTADYALTGVTRLRGANTNLPENTAVNCLNNEEFFNQYLQTIDWVNDTDAATITMDMDTSNRHRVTITDDRILEFDNAVSGQGFMVRILQDGSGSHTVTWPANISWADDVEPTLTTTADKADFFVFMCTNDTTPTYDGFIVGQNL